MIYLLDGKPYDVEIIKKGNKNTYIRIKDNFVIQVTTNYFINKNDIKSLLDRNEEFLRNTINKKIRQKEKEEVFKLLGKNYDVVESNAFSKVEIVENKIYIPSKNIFERWLKKEMLSFFNKRLKYNYELFKENIPYPTLRIRTMKTRWGVCNRKSNTVTLNSNLIKESIDKTDYVIIHELSHFIEFNHSVDFWNIVSKYCPGYKRIRKELRE